MKRSNEEIRLQRMRRHKVAEEHLQRSEFAQAERVLNEAIEQYGPHVGLLSDLCAVQYMRQGFSDFSLSVLRLRKEFKENEDRLSEESFLRTTLTLGKFCEELLLLTEAMDYYSLGSKSSRPQSAFPGLIQKHEAQKLRLYASLDFPIRDLSESYNYCLSYDKNDKDLDIELNHALLLAEMELNSPALAYPRLQRILECENLSSDARLVFFDFIEVAFRKNNLSPQLCELLKNDLTKYPSLANFDDYELTLLDLLNQSLHIDSKSLLSHRHSPFCRLKLLCIFEKTKSAQGLLGSYRLLVEALPPSSRNLIEKSFGFVFHQQRISIFLNPDGILQLGTATLKLKKNSFSEKILRSMLTENLLSIEQCIRIIYDEDYSESAFLKLRVSLSRMNTLIEGACGIPKALYIKNGHLEFAANLVRS